MCPTDGACVYDGRLVGAIRDADLEIIIPKGYNNIQSYDFMKSD